MMLHTTFLRVVHPIEHDFRCSAVAGGDIASHNLRLCSSEPKIQQPDLIISTHSYITGFNVLYSGKEIQARDELDKENSA